jgi:SWI/SNF-related matrix-associated actin-dependent regulator of chromatin subfamily A member 5
MTEIRNLEGKKIDFIRKKAATKGEISEDWIIKSSDVGEIAKREKISRSTQNYVEGFGIVNVLKANSYSIENGEPSVFDQEGKNGRFDSLKEINFKRKKKIFENQETCQVCWDYGNLICCRLCPASYHLKCLGFKSNPTWNWNCPHHGSCVKCNKSANFNFRCEVCPNAYCEDCLPQDFEFVGGVSKRWESLGFDSIVSNACFIYCSESCKSYMNEA